MKGENKVIPPGAEEKRANRENESKSICSETDQQTAGASPGIVPHILRARSVECVGQLKR